MYYYKEELINIIKPDKPDPAVAKVLREMLGGRFGRGHAPSPRLPCAADAE